MAVRIKCGNAFELIKEVEANSVDLILTDPPYDQNPCMPSLKDEEKEVMAREFARVLKPTGSIALFCGFYDKWKWYNLLTQNGLFFQQEIVWVYPNPARTRFKNIKHFIPAHEAVLWFTKSKEGYYFDGSGCLERTWLQHVAFNSACRTKENNPPEKLGITPKPIKLSDILVKRLCPPGGTVLDPFMGFGTFGISAQKFNRNYIGFEIRKEVFEVAERRLKNLKFFSEERNNYER